MEEIKLCKECSGFTLQEMHCNKKTITPAPAKFSVEDKYEDYKRKAKEPELQKRGLL